MNFTPCIIWMIRSPTLTLLWGQTFQRVSGSVSSWMRMVNGSQDPVCNRLKLSSVRGIKVSTFWEKFYWLTCLHFSSHPEQKKNYGV